MEISTSTNICAFQRGRSRLPVEFAIETCAKAGYKVLDINFCMAMNPESPLRTDHWKEYIESIGELAASHGIRFNQSHLPYYDVDKEKGTDKAEMMEVLITRSIIGTSILGAKWAVTHPFTVYDAASNMQTNRNVNLQYYAPHVETAVKYGVGIALENDFEYNRSQPMQRIYCASIYELIDLCDAFHNPEHVGICYDFGHGNLTGGFHRQNLNAIGSRLKAVHVQDNHGETDEHLMPFYGSIDWEDAMAGLADIHFAGDLTFEIQEWGRYLPTDLKYTIAEHSLIIGNRLLDYVKKAQSIPS